MQHYSDEKNKAGMRVLFMIAQMLVLGMVYIIVYTSFVAVGYAIKEYGVSWVMYIPVVAVLLLFPVLLYQYRKMFSAGKMLGAFVWMMATASLVIVLLYVYVAQLIP
jgi:energy-coupling factor transporter transmembrane protein EcfT